MTIKFMRLTETAVLPSQKYPTDAGIDICADHDVTIPAKGFAVVPTGIAWDGMHLEDEECDMKEFYRTNSPYLIIQSRSGMAINKNIECSKAGVIDATYTGEIKVKLYNYNDTPFEVKAGDRIAQAVFGWKPVFKIVEVNSIEETERGAKGFGSTGDRG